jgi:hypothetical protein
MSTVRSDHFNAAAVPSPVEEESGPAECSYLLLWLLALILVVCMLISGTQG